LLAVAVLRKLSRRTLRTASYVESRKSQVKRNFMVVCETEERKPIFSSR
jgi:hypothetical protein